MTNKIDINFIAISILVVLAMFSSIRNLSFFYYFAVLASVGFLFFSIPRFKLGFHALIFYFFCFYTLIMICWSGIYWGSLEFLPGIPRALFMPLITLTFFFVLTKEHQFIQLSKIMLFCFLLAGFSIFYQIAYGAITWFAPAVTRSGLDRYASLLGSLTIFGSIVGYAIIVAFKVLKNPQHFLVALFICLAGIFSLSKAGVMMIIISSIVLFGFEWRRLKIKNVLIILFFLTILIFLARDIDVIQSYYNSIVSLTLGPNTIFANSSSVILDSPRVSIDQITARLFSWTSFMLKDYGDIVYLTGVGLQGGAGTMGIDGYASAHNSFGDLFFMGGLPYLAIFIVLYFATQYTHFLNRGNQISRLFFMVNILFLANMVVASGAVFQPAISSLFWLSVVYANLVNNNRIA